jgi:hypothetical protein
LRYQLHTPLSARHRSNVGRHYRHYTRYKNKLLTIALNFLENRAKFLSANWEDSSAAHVNRIKNAKAKLQIFSHLRWTPFAKVEFHQFFGSLGTNTFSSSVLQGASLPSTLTDSNAKRIFFSTLQKSAPAHPKSPGNLLATNFRRGIKYGMSAHLPHHLDYTWVMIKRCYRKRSKARIAILPANILTIRPA